MEVFDNSEQRLGGSYSSVGIIIRSHIRFCEYLFYFSVRHHTFQHRRPEKQKEYIIN
jgi:hypothetical protein